MEQPPLPDHARAADREGFPQPPEGAARLSAADREGAPAPRVAVVGRGRMGTALAAGLREAGVAVEGPLGRGETPRGAGAVILAVPDGQIAAAAAALDTGPLVGHCSGATGLDALAPHEAFSLHPLMTVTEQGARFHGASCAVAGSSPRAHDLAVSLARRLGMRPVTVAEEDRAAYHAAASIASNFLVTLQSAAERLAATAGVDREHLVPLVRATVDNWAAHGPERALTGPVARGDQATVERHRAEIERRAPELLPVWEELVAATRRLAGTPRGADAPREHTEVPA